MVVLSQVLYTFSRPLFLTDPLELPQAQIAADELELKPQKTILGQEWLKRGDRLRLVYCATSFLK